MPESSETVASTPSSTAAAAQSRTGETEVSASAGDTACPGEGRTFCIGRGVTRAVHAAPYERKPDDPVYRPLRIFTLDPELSAREGAVALINIPYEPLQAGPIGKLLEVDNYDGWQNVTYTRVDLDAPINLIQNGRTPSASDHHFHQQMVYAVCSTVYATFRGALGRQLGWGFDRSEEAPARLLLRPHACEAPNAYYDKERGELCFGYYQAPDEVAGMNLPRQYVFSCLSHDIIAHEVTHALLDGLRAQFCLPTNHDVLAFHEAFADLIALFQHFSYDQVVLSAIRASRGNLFRAELLTDLARQFGHTTGLNGPLRSAALGIHRAIHQGSEFAEEAQRDDVPMYRPDTMEVHELGSVLVAAVFEAFVTVFERKTAPLRRLASGGTGVLPPGELPADLQTLLAKEASGIASQFLNMCIRAIDYCPPVDIRFGEFLRAVITADYDLVPDDPWGYREAWIAAFRRRKIYPTHVQSLSESALLWRGPRRPIAPLAALSFATLRFNGDPGQPANVEELRRQACALGALVTRSDLLEEFGLAPPDARTSLPRVESIRSSRRVGPDSQVVFDLVAEVTQTRRVPRLAGSRPGASGEMASGELEQLGGATLILNPKGEVRYSISKNVLSEARLDTQRQYIGSDSGRAFWNQRGNRWLPAPHPFRLLHQPEDLPGR